MVGLKEWEAGLKAWLCLSQFPLSKSPPLPPKCGPWSPPPACLRHSDSLSSQGPPQRFRGALWLATMRLIRIMLSQAAPTPQEDGAPSSGRRDAGTGRPQMMALAVGQIGEQPLSM